MGPGLAVVHVPHLTGSLRLIMAIWRDSLTGRLDSAFINPVALTRGFFRRTPPRNEARQPIVAGTSPVTLGVLGPGPLALRIGESDVDGGDGR